MPFVRNLVSVVAGIFAGGLVIAAVEAFGHAVLEDGSVFVAAVTGYGLGALAGSIIAARFGSRLCAAIVSAALAVLAAVNLFAFPHPGWFAPTAILCLALGWAVGVRIAGGASRRDPGLS